MMVPYLTDYFTLLVTNTFFLLCTSKYLWLNKQSTHANKKYSQRKSIGAYTCKKDELVLQLLGFSNGMQYAWVVPSFKFLSKGTT